MSLKKKRIGELEGSPLVIGDNNLVNDFETLVEMNPDNTIKDIKKRKGDQFHTIINNETINSQVDLLNELTEDGDFGAEVLKASASVTDDELISLFGDVDALDGMSRRNALTKQMLSLLSANKTNIEEYEGENFSIGNGEKVSTQVFYYDGTETEYIINWNLNQLGTNAKENTSILYVIFNLSKKTISIINPGIYIEDGGDDLKNNYGVEAGNKVVAYPTCATDGTNVSDKSFGTFTIKTRSV